MLSCTQYAFSTVLARAYPIRGLMGLACHVRRGCLALSTQGSPPWIFEARLPMENAGGQAQENTQRQLTLTTSPPLYPSYLHIFQRRNLKSQLFDLTFDTSTYLTISSRLVAPCYPPSAPQSVTARPRARRPKWQGNLRCSSLAGLHSSQARGCRQGGSQT